MNPPAESIERARRILAAYAENDSDPWTRSLLAEAIDSIGPRVSGPSRARQRAVAKRDHALRSFHRRELRDLSARAAANLIVGKVARYSIRRLGTDVEGRTPPVDRLELIAFEAATAKISFPKAERLREILAES